MKKYLLLVCLVVSGYGAFSQLNKGQWLAGGNASFSYNKTSQEYFNTKPNSTITLQVSPDAGYFFVDNVAAGVRVNYLHAWFRPLSNSFLTSQRELNLSPFIRFYVLPKASKVNLFAEASFIYGKTSANLTSQDSAHVDSKYTYTTKGYSVAAGTVIFLNSRLGLEFTVTYENTDTNNGAPEYNTINIMGGVGFQIHLEK